MSRIGALLCLSLVLPLAACSPGPGAAINPLDVKASDLEGWWVNRDDPQQTRVFGFASPEDGPWSIPVSVAHRASPVSAVYTADANLRAPTPMQYATYEVQGGKLLQTVMDDVTFNPGQQFSTDIRALFARQALTLESPTAAEGQRTYQFHEHCPTTAATGYSRMASLDCPSYYATAPSLAFDSRGRLHSYTALAGPSSGSCPARPTYGVLSRGCVTVQFTLPNARASSLAVDAADVVHLVTTASAIGSEHPDQTLLHRWRHTDAEQWSEEVLSTLQSGRELQLRARGERLVLVTQRLSASADPGTIELFERTASGWAVAIASAGGQPLRGNLAGSGLDPAGRLVVVLEGSGSSQTPGAFREVAPGDFEALPAPAGDASRRAMRSAYVDDAGRVHQLFSSSTGAQHGILEDGAWRFLSAPRAEALVPRPAAPWAFTSRTGETFPKLVLATQEDDGLTRYEVAEPAYSGLNKELYTRSASAVAADGTLALTTNGELTLVKRPRAPWGETGAVDLTITLGGTGTGRVVSEDGRFDCRATCTVSVPAYSRFRLRLEPDAHCAVVKVGAEVDDFATQYAWVTAWPLQTQEQAQTKNTAAFDFDRTPLREVIAVSATPTSPSSVNLFDARGGDLAVVAATTAGTVAWRDGTVSAGGTGAGEVLLLERGGGTPVVRRLPAAPAALGLLTAGGVQGLYFANRALAFEGATVGAAAAPVVARVAWDTALSQQPVESLVTLPSGTGLLAAATDASGSAALLVRNPNGFPALGVSVQMALAWRSATGAFTLAPFPANVLVTAATLGLSGTRAVVAAGDTLFFFDGGASSGTRTLGKATVSAVTLTAQGVAAIVTATAGGIDLGDGPRNSTSGQKYLGRYDAAGGFVSAEVLAEPATKPLAFAPHSRGLLLLDQTQAGPAMMILGANRFEYLTRVANAVKALSARVDGDSLWVLVQQQQGTVDYGLTELTGAGRSVLLKAEVP